MEGGSERARKKEREKEGGREREGISHAHDQVITRDPDPPPFAPGERYLVFETAL